MSKLVDAEIIMNSLSRRTDVLFRHIDISVQNHDYSNIGVIYSEIEAIRRIEQFLLVEIEKANSHKSITDS